jgi:hypothetical protein
MQGLAQVLPGVFKLMLLEPPQSQATVGPGVLVVFFECSIIGLHRSHGITFVATLSKNLTNQIVTLGSRWKKR